MQMSRSRIWVPPWNPRTPAEIQTTRRRMSMGYGAGTP